MRKELAASTVKPIKTDHSAVEKLEECTSARQFIEEQTHSHTHLSN